MRGKKGNKAKLDPECCDCDGGLGLGYGDGDCNSNDCAAGRLRDDAEANIGACAGACACTVHDWL